MRASPAFQFYPDDFLGGVSDMTQGEVGAYILLLCQQWNRGSIPVQPDRQRLLAKGDVSDHVLSKFRHDENGLLRNERLETERQKQAQYREAQKVKGQKSGQSRRTAAEHRLNPCLNPERTEGQPNTNSPSPSPSSVQKKVQEQEAPAPTSETATFLALLDDFYMRQPGQKHSHAEETGAFDVAKRPNWRTEFSVIQSWRNSLPAEERKFFPQSMAALLGDWQRNLDRANSLKAATPYVRKYGVRGIL